MLRRFALVLALLLLTAVPVAATSGDWIDVTCPVCENEFEGWEFHSTNTFGGTDRDFCEHARGSQVFLRVCWTCPKCAYTGMQPDFEPDGDAAPLVAKLKAKNTLKPARKLDPKTKRTDEIEAWVRWDLRVQVLNLREDAAVEDRAWACLVTAHTQRFGLPVASSLQGGYEELYSTYAKRGPTQTERERAYDRSVRVARSLETDARDPELPLTKSERRSRLLVAALTFLRRGESPAAERVLTILPEEQDELPSDVRSLIEELKQRIARERKYIGLAVPFYETVVKEEGREARERMNISYLLGELQRKLGHHKEALACLEPLQAKELPDGFKLWVADAIKKTKEAMKAK